MKFAHVRGIVALSAVLSLVPAAAAARAAGELAAVRDGRLLRWRIAG